MILGKMKIVFLTVLFIIFANPASGIEIKDRNEYLWDVRGDDGDIYLNRLSLDKKLESYDIETSLFAEAQWNIKTSEWEKIIAGAEIGKNLCKYVYAGQTLQGITGELLDYMDFNPGNESAETTTKIYFNFPVLENTLDQRLALRLFEEYSFNLEELEAGLNEIGADLTYDLLKNSSIGIGWRHTDRIHNFDTDYVSSFFILSF